MRILVYFQLIGLLCGLVLILLATRFRTNEHPVWYKSGPMTPFYGKKLWWNGPGYFIQLIGSSLFAIGILSGGIYWGRYIGSCFQ